jgi:hypothetical protein
MFDILPRRGRGEDRKKRKREGNLGKTEGKAKKTLESLK